MVFHSYASTSALSVLSSPTPCALRLSSDREVPILVVGPAFSLGLRVNASLNITPTDYPHSTRWRTSYGKSRFRFETKTWQLGAELHDTRNRMYVSMGQCWKAILGFKAILELFLTSFVGRKWKWDVPYERSYTHLDIWNSLSLL